MGKNNRARRRAKAGTRHRHAASRQGGAQGSGQSFRRSDPPPGESEEIVRYHVSRLMGDAFVALDAGLGDLVDDASSAIAQRCSETRGQRVVATTLVGGMLDATSEAWSRGWQPADIHRYAGRRLSGPEQSLVLDVMSDELTGYASSTVDRRWHAQIEELEGGVWWPASQTWLHAHRERGVDWTTLISRTLAVLHLLLGLPRLECLTPLPGTVKPPAVAPDVRAATEGPVVDERILSRVRQLLAKAESTTFEAEAETFTAGAQALMARHSIDAALLAAADPHGHRGEVAPHGRRIGIDNPYDGPKAMLLDAVASANRCRMIWSREFGFGTVVGFEADLESVEVLFTSLLVQATRAVTKAGSRTDAYGRSRTRSFRHSFLMSFAGRIGERLEQVTAEEVQTASAAVRSGGQELVPLLEARAEEVDRTVEGWFPTLTTKPLGAARDAE
ncbi:MAG: DUF2786 domain-containing protein, partial [Micrococcales bacterium]|nr:DUF2786 domain-containing protein [Micrococcales bacterium]